MQEQSSLKTHFTVIIALIIKELQVRFGTRKLGYLWLILEPILHIVPFYFIRRLLSNTKEIDLIIFLVTGIVTVLFFTKSVTKLQSSISANQALLAYRQIKPMDLVLSRLVIECIISIAIFILMMAIFVLYFATIPHMRIFPVAVFALILLTILAFSFGVIFMVLTTRIPVLETVVPHIMRLVYLTSGAFFSVSDVPYSIRPLLLLNPIVHTVEILRFNMLPTQTTNHGDIIYLLMFTIITLFIALLLYFINKHKLV
jgi:capsular polysaccharide transport system permease protein